MRNDGDDLRGRICVRAGGIGEGNVAFLLPGKGAALRSDEGVTQLDDKQCAIAFNDERAFLDEQEEVSVCPDTHLAGALGVTHAESRAVDAADVLFLRYRFQTTAGQVEGRGEACCYA